MAFAVINCLRSPASRWSRSACLFIWVYLTVFIGLRHEVGGDWFNYLPYLERAKGINLGDTLIWGDPGYNTLNWFFSSSSLGIYGVNLVSAGIFSYGLIDFCRVQRRPWLALSVSIPYLVVVVAMGYTRQAISLGLLMSGLTWLEKKHIAPFVIYISAAATFHSTILVMLGTAVPLISANSWLKRVIKFIFLVITGVSLYVIFLSSRVDSLISGYIVSEYQSEGAVIRVAMSFIPAVTLLIYRTRLGYTESQLRLWTVFSLASVFCAIAVILFPTNTTAIDRIALYLIPLQISTISRVPDIYLFGVPPRNTIPCILAIFVLVQFVWLNFAVNAYAWLPYENILLR